MWTDANVMGLHSLIEITKEKNLLKGYVMGKEEIEITHLYMMCLYNNNFQKAYDSTKWNFWGWMVENMRYNFSKVEKVEEDLHKISNHLCLRNGSPSKEFSVEKRVRARDLLSPFLYLMVARGLYSLIEIRKEKNLLKGYVMGKEEIEIIHLQFTDDTVFFYHESVEDIYIGDKKHQENF
ncbi:hypothetical protein CR513_46308, partial [Mucuna pruriens]